MDVMSLKQQIFHDYLRQIPITRPPGRASRKLEGNQQRKLDFHSSLHRIPEDNLCKRSLLLLLQVMSVVRTLTKEGMTIVATIHSPTPYCFNLFDRLMILIGGYAIYHGPNGESKNSFSFILQSSSVFSLQNLVFVPCGSLRALLVAQIISAFALLCSKMTENHITE